VGGTEKVWSLAFANDLVIEGKSAREMRKKNLEVNVEKTKMMVSIRERGRVKRMSGLGRKKNRTSKRV
jgi:hypothetical protein